MTYVVTFNYLPPFPRVFEIRGCCDMLSRMKEGVGGCTLMRKHRKSSVSSTV